MLSNQQQQPARPMARRLIKHERQRSTPVVPMLNPESAGYFPETIHTQGITRQRQAPIGHRRGLSLDPSMRLQDLRLTHTRSPLGNHGMVSTNQGPVYQQHTMREAQMHGLSRPGHIDHGLGNIMEDPNIINIANDNFAALNEADDHFLACFIEAHRTQTPERLQSRSYTPNNMSLNASPNPYSNASTPREPNFTQSSPIRHGSIDLGLQNIPMMNRGGSFQGQIPMKRSQSQNSAPPSMMNGNTFRMPVFAPTPVPPLDFTNMVNLDFDLQGYQTGYDSSNYSPTQTSPAGSSVHGTPDLPPVTLFGEIINDIPQLTASEAGSVPPSPTKSRSSSPRKKPAPLPEEMIIEETGITAEQVDAFIQGPDPITNKFSCLFEGCNMKPFGRKENIRAHVQTHLGDRKYVCTVCDNRFVRPNDLKRHAIIHQEVKEYICKCGSAFGRQDALRRHRIRKPFCMDGDPTLELLRKEEKKRGRPKKIAPTETNERRERKENIRKQVMEQKRKGSLPRSAGSPGKSVRSCSPEDLHQKSSSPTNMSLTPPMSPAGSLHRMNVAHQYPTLESSVARLSLSPPPTRESMTDNLSQEFGIGPDSPFGTDHFSSEPFSGPASPPHSSASPYGTPPELDLSSSPAASKFTIDFSDPEFTQSTTTSIHDFGALPSSANFSDEFLSDSVLMDQLLANSASQEGLKAESMEEIERFLMLDSM